MASFCDNVYDASTDEEEGEEVEDWTKSFDDPHDTPTAAQLIASHPSKAASRVIEGVRMGEGVKVGQGVKVEEGVKEGEGALLSRMKLNDHKAGMEGLDRERINKIIFDASKGSRFYENEQKRELQVTARIAEQQRRLEELTDTNIIQGEAEADVLLAAIEGSRDFSRNIVHVDMDAFYAAVEMRDNPKLRHVPMAVGGNSMLSTSNYLARRFGVRAAMPGFIAKKLCPQLIIVPCNFVQYTAVSKQVRAVMAEYDPNFSPMSLDEAYLDFTNHLKKRKALTVKERTYKVMLKEEEMCRCEEGKGGRSEKEEVARKQEDEKRPEKQEEKGKEGKMREEKKEEEVKKEERIQGNGLDEVGELVQVLPPGGVTEAAVCPSCGRYVSEESGRMEEFGLDVEEAVREMRARIHGETKLTASAGIAPNMMLAKVCSDRNKPNGQYFLPPTRDDVMTFITQLDIRKIGGVGKVAERMLRSVGLETCGDLYMKRGILYHLYSKTSFNYFMRITLGVGSTTVDRDGERKSMSVERTFGELHDPKDLYEKCLELSESLSEDLQQEELVGKTVGIKLKTVKFDLKTRARSLTFPTSNSEQIYGAASELLRTEIQLIHPHPLRLRLMGVRMSNLLPKHSVGDQQQSTIKTLLEKMKAAPKSTPGLEDGLQSQQCNKAEEQLNQPTPTQVTEPPATGIKPENKPSLSSLPHLPTELVESAESDPSAESALRSHGQAGSQLRSGKRRTSSKMNFLCPVCSRQMDVPDLETFNKHIDGCLRGEAGGGGGEIERVEIKDSESPQDVTCVRKDGELHLDEENEGRDEDLLKDPDLEPGRVKFNPQEKSGLIQSSGGVPNSNMKQTFDKENGKQLAPTSCIIKQGLKHSKKDDQLNENQDLPTSYIKKEEVPEESESVVSLHGEPVDQKVHNQAKDRPSIFPLKKTSKALTNWLKQEKDIKSTSIKYKDSKYDASKLPSLTAPEAKPQESCSSVEIVEKPQCKPQGSDCGEGTSSSNNDSLICPICNAVMKNKNLILFNKHIDLCLGKTSNTEQPQSGSADKVSQGHFKVKSDQGQPVSAEKASRTENKNKITSTKNKGPGVKNRPQGCNDEVVPQLDSGSGGVEDLEKDCFLSCPVCSLSQLWMSFKVFNNHVEACLNRSAIKEILHAESASDTPKRRRESPTSDEKQAKKKKQNPNIKTIDSFFKRR